MKAVRNYVLSFLVAVAVLIFGVGMFFSTNANAAETKAAPSMEITEKDLSANKYETYYYAEGIHYTYKGKAVTFNSETEFTTEDGTFSLKNKKTDISVVQEDGNVKISLSNVTTPVGSISGAWNSSWGGATQLVWKTDILGQEEVRSSNLKQPIIFENLKPGTYHLTQGSIYEKANSYSPGYDFGDGKGKVKENYFGTLPDITFTVAGAEEEDVYLGDKTEAKVYDDFKNDIWLQYQQKDMKVGDTATIYPWRMEQIITDPINNDVARPNFNFEVIKGENIIEVTPERSTEDTTMLESGAYDKAKVTAKQAGTAVVKVTYDARTYKQKTWGACSKVNTAYVVFTVGEGGKAVINTNDAFKNWRHYDTIYYTSGNTVPYTFTVNTENATDVKVTLNGEKIKPTSGNSYTANLENRSNIIGIVAKDADGNVKSMYRIIDARFMEVNIENKVTGQKEIKAGDTAIISFKGITMPVYKLATIYNPQFGANATYAAYSNSRLGDFKGQCNQWDLAENNSFEVTFKKQGDYTFTSDGIHCTWWGSELGTDMTMEGVGEPNHNALTYGDVFATLPDFTVSVAKADVAPMLTLNTKDKVLYEGQEFQLTTAEEFDNITWTSSDNNIATVDKTGKVNAIKKGTATITAIAGNQKAECKITVKQGLDPIKNLTLALDERKESTSYLSEGRSGKTYISKKIGYLANVEAPEGMDTAVTWSLSDDSVAQIAYTKENGVIVVGIKEGTTNLICVTKEGTTTATVKITVSASDWGSMLGSTLNYSINNVDKLTIEDAAYVGALRKAYDALTDVNKENFNRIYTSALKNLVAAEERIDLLTAREEAQKELAQYKDAASYREAERKQLEDILTDANAKIAEAKNEGEVDKILAEAKEKMDALKTDAQYRAEESKNNNKPSTSESKPTSKPASQTTAKKQKTKAAKLKKTRVKVKAGKKTAKLRWKKIKGAKGYQIYRATSKNGKYKKIKTVSAKKNTFLDKKVKRHKRYYYRVRVYSKSGNKKIYSVYSKKVTVRIK